MLHKVFNIILSYPNVTSIYFLIINPFVVVVAVVVIVVVRHLAMVNICILLRKILICLFCKSDTSVAFKLVFNFSEIIFCSLFK